MFELTPQMLDAPSIQEGGYFQKLPNIETGGETVRQAIARYTQCGYEVIASEASLQYADILRGSFDIHTEYKLRFFVIMKHKDSTSMEAIKGGAIAEGYAPLMAYFGIDADRAADLIGSATRV